MGRAKITEEEYIAIKAKWEAEKFEKEQKAAEKAAKKKA